MFKRTLIALAVLVTPLSVNAALIDFTDISWKNTISGNSASLGGISLISTGGNLTFNAGDNGGCWAGKNAGIHNLACAGDGVGINNDEITENYNTRVNQSITVSFDSAVDVNNIYLLDLFGSERTGEKAVIDGDVYWSLGALNNIGGFFTTNYSAQGITSIVLSGYNDFFSDYALAAVEVSPVPIPGAVFLFGTALLGFMGFKRISK